MGNTAFIPTSMKGRMNCETHMANNTARREAGISCRHNAVYRAYAKIKDKAYSGVSSRAAFSSASFFSVIRLSSLLRRRCLMYQTRPAIAAAATKT